MLYQEPQILLIDLNPLSVHPKVVPPEHIQLPNESLRFWNNVTTAILSRQFSKATQVKVEIEEAQRVKAKRREESGVEWKPWFFIGAITPVGKPELTKEGEAVLKDLQEGKWDLQSRMEPGA
jgi:oxysterol-binding protein-related protein 9/10/11